MIECLFYLSEREKRLLRRAQVVGNETTQDRLGSRRILSGQRNFRRSQGNRLFEIPLARAREHRREDGVRFSEP